MQIHEITQKPLSQIDEAVMGSIGQGLGKAVSGVKNIGSAVAAPFRDVASGYKTGRQDQQIAAMADKAYRAWTAYAQQLRKSVADRGDPKALDAFDQRKDPLYKKSLLAFVQKNLLGNINLSNATNQADILSIVNSLSAPGSTTTSKGTSKPKEPPVSPPGKTPPPTPPGSTPPTGGTPQYGKNLGSTATYNQPTGVPSTQNPIPPGIKQQAKGATPAASAAPTGPKVTAGPVTPAERAEYEKKLAAAAAKTPVAEALDAATEKQLFTQLVRAAAMASTEASTERQQPLAADQFRSTGNKQIDQALVKQGYKLQP